MKPSSVLAVMALLALAACDSRNTAGVDADERPAATAPIAAGEMPAPFDRALATSVARALLRRAEADLPRDSSVRIVRRGQEQRPVTRDFRPGRMSVELDDDGSGRYVVTRVSVEVPEGGPLVVE